jgi:hypothetical protein
MSRIMNNEEIVQHRTLQYIVFIFSIVFIFVLSNGYYNLLVTKNQPVAFFAAIALAGLAWSLAKFIGSSKDKIKGNIPLFVLLLILSAVGVFNSLMINLEGKRIYLEAIESSQSTFKELNLTTKKLLKNPDIEAKKNRVDSLMASFTAELKNPQNCGQGPVAKELASQLKSELDGFEILSGPANGPANCKNIDRIIGAYRKTVDDLLINSKEYTKGNYKETSALSNEVEIVEKNAQDQLNKLKADVNNGDNGNILIHARNNLEDVASKYQVIAQKVSAISNDPKIPQRSLDLNSVRNLGEWSQIINLIISRKNELSTYVYLSLALFFDWILIYLFASLSDLKRALPNKRSAQKTTNISTPW